MPEEDAQASELREAKEVFDRHIYGFAFVFRRVLLRNMGGCQREKILNVMSDHQKVAASLP
jgi:hypothetical protein